MKLQYEIKTDQLVSHSYLSSAVSKQLQNHLVMVVKEEEAKINLNLEIIKGTG